MFPSPPTLSCPSYFLLSFAPQYGAKQLLVVTSTSISVKNLASLLKQAVLDMKMAGVDEPVGGYTSEQLREHLYKNQAERGGGGANTIGTGWGILTIMM